MPMQQMMQSTPPPPPSCAQDATFLVIGAGGLGAPLLLALGAAGARRLVIVDPDLVDESNLQRQVLYRTRDVGRPKVLAAKDALLRRWPGLSIEPVRARFDETSARALATDADVLCEGSDDLATKFLANDVAHALGRSVVIGGVLRHAGQVFPVRPGRDACYRCLFESLPSGDAARCADAGVFGATCGEVGALQARAALALAGDPAHDALLGRVWLVEPGGTRKLTLRPRAGCTGCGAVESPAAEVSSMLATTHSHFDTRVTATKA
ncbi:MAG: hypothetical protein EXR73_05755 [Myxococcales bacterium]|nr:hypothetical protein [Myxococcales bacterium]